jgi:hypothetical protein
VFFRDHPLQLSLKFVGKAGAYSSEAHFRLERLARDKNSSLFRKSVNYGLKRFYSTGPQERENGQNNIFKK